MRTCPFPQFFRNPCNLSLFLSSSHLPMDHDLHDFFGPAASHRLSVSEKEELFQALRARLPTAETEVYHGSALWRGLSGLFSGWAPFAAAVIILVLTGAGITSAESTLPGDFLYPLKRIRESINASVRFSTESKATLEAERMGRRLDEADALEAKGQLTENTTAEIDQAYRLERRDATRHIVELEAEGKADVAASMRARLNAAEDRYERLFKGKRRRQPPEAVLPAAAVDVSASFRR